MSRCTAEVHPIIPRAAKPYQFAVYPLGHPDRNRIEAFVRYGFARAYDARITSFMPVLFSLLDANDRPVAAAGCRPAADQKLFIEQYLDEPIEQLLNQHIAAGIQRHDIVEVGNLVGETAGATRVLISAMGRWLGAKGYRAVCCNVTNTVANAFRKHGIPLAPLIAADKNRLGAAAIEWGRYYERPCTVMAALIPECFRSGSA
jgi:hypothetical protein